jgi:hypothetical protein
MKYELHHQDVMEFLAEYDGAPFHAWLDDPPYHLTIEKRFGKPGSAPAKGGVYKRASSGFMNLAWDGGDITFQPELWARTSNVLYPGAYGFSFGGSRTGHRLAVAAEDGGMECVDSLSMVYGSGFPKAHNIAKAIDMASGTEREVVGTVTIDKGIQGGSMHAGRPRNVAEVEETVATHPLAQTFEGHRGGMILKPAHEPIYLLRKPYAEITDRQLRQATGWDFWHSKREGIAAKKLNKRYGLALPKGDYTVISRKAMLEHHKSDVRIFDDKGELIEVVNRKPYKPWATTSIAANVIVNNGAGSIWIDGGRLAGAPEETRFDPVKHNHDGWRMNHTGKQTFNTAQRKEGIFPSNLLLQHLPGCECLGHRTVKNDSVVKPGQGETRTVYGKFVYNATYNPPKTSEVMDWDCQPGCPVLEMAQQMPSDKAHLFFQGDWAFDQAEHVLIDPAFQYVTKPSRLEKDAGLAQLPDVLAKRLNEGGLSNEERFQPVLVKNPHPAAKSIKLCQYLATLLLPPRMYDKEGNPIPRRIIVRFAGSGSEMIGCLLAGWDEVIGIEVEEIYLPVTHARLAFWVSQIEAGLRDVDAILKRWKEQPVGAKQLNLF